MQLGPSGARNSTLSRSWQRHRWKSLCHLQQPSYVKAVSQLSYILHIKSEEYGPWRGIRAVCCAGLVYLNLNKCARRSKNALPPKKKCGEQPNKYLHNHAVQISQPSEATDCSKQVLSYSWQN